MTRPFFGLLVIPLALGGLASGQTSSGADSPPRVSPRPQVEDYGQGVIKVAESNAGVLVSSEDARLLQSGALKAGIRLLARRLDQLSSVKLATEMGSEAAARATHTRAATVPSPAVQMCRTQ